MNSDQIPEDGITHPLFISPTPYQYQITYRTTRKADQVLNYNSPHEIILCLYCFKDDDRIIYFDRDTQQEVFTITVGKFKYRIAESITQASPQQLELLYMRLLLTNRYSKTIPDRGRFGQLDHIFRQFLLTIRGGHDVFLTSERLHTILYAKARRESALHTLAIIGHWNNQNDIHFCHINLPTTMENRGLVDACLRMELTKKGFRLYSYDPVPEDNILPTPDISAEISLVINQLIK